MLRIHPEARQEFHRAAAYYRKISRELAKRFVLEVEEVFVKILENPILYPIHSEDARAKLLHDFPYSIIYLTEKDNVYIVAIMHQKRMPNYWRNRL
ncbi:MAG TPA: type II toxin-antitoxin system RelE/ParE family toxin [Candidatus Kapabacteria bacterium]|nr:type II toxin-antitoxin system RelE/ParE family toxin [Candidatus Kapabacteria bacterium]